MKGDGRRPPAPYAARVARWVSRVSDRRERILRALEQLIERRRAYDFQNLAFHILKSVHQSLILSEWNHDGGEDAFMLPPRGGGGDVSLACSLTADQGKVLADCRRILERGVQPRMMIFATPRAVERTTVDKWKAAVKQECGIELEVIGRNGIVAELERPENDWICREYLHLQVAPARELQTLIARARENARRQSEEWREVHDLEWSQLLDLRLRAANTSADERREASQLEGGAQKEQRLSAFAEQLTAGRHVVVHAPGGAGKTTALLQVGEYLLRKDAWLVPVYVSLSEWSTLHSDFESHIARELGIQPTELRQLDNAGALVLLLNGWNEIGVEELPWARKALTHALRQLPNACVVLTTREHAEAPPLTRAELLAIASLSDSERQQAIRQAGIDRPEEVGERLERNHTLDALTRLPLFLRVALSVLKEAEELPPTADGLLTAFVKRTEGGEHHGALQDVCRGFHRDYLADVAALLTDDGAASLRLEVALHCIGDTSKRLAGAGLIGTLPDARAVLQVLRDHHVLSGSGHRSGTISFAHPLFQAWFAARSLEQMVRYESAEAAATGSAPTTRASGHPSDPLLGRTNLVPWGVAMELLVERLSAEADETRNSASLQRVMHAAAEVDLEFCCRLYGHGPEQMMGDVGTELPGYLRALYAAASPEDRTYALAGMVATRSPQFAEILWAVLQEGREAVWNLLHGREEFSLRSLGPTWWERIQEVHESVRGEMLDALIVSVLPEERRSIAEWVGRDPSQAVRAQAIAALDTAGEMRLAARLLRNDPQSLKLSPSRQLLRRCSPDEIRELAGVLRSELETTDDDEVRVDLLSAMARADLVSPDSVVTELQGALDRAYAEHSKGPVVTRLLERLASQSPEAAGLWVLEHGVAGGSVERDWFVHLSAAPAERLVRLVDELTTASLEGESASATRGLLWVYTKVHRPEVAKALSRNWLRVLRALYSAGEYVGRERPWLEELFRGLEHAIREQPYAMRADAMLAISDVPRNASELYEVRRLLGPTGAMETSAAAEMPDALRQQLRESVLVWETRLREVGELTRSTLSSLADLLSETADPRDVAKIRTWLEEDLELWDREISEREQGRGRGFANVSHTNWYAGSLARLATDAAAATLIDLLGHREYLGAASAGLAHLAVGAPPWRGRVSVRRERVLGRGGAPRGIDQPQALPGMPDERDRFASAITAAIEMHLRDRNDGQSRPYAHDFGEAAGALGRLGYAPALPLIFELGQLDHYEWGVLRALEYMAAWGIVLPAQDTEAFVDVFLERLSDPLRASSQDPWPYQLSCFALLLLSDAPGRGVARIRSIIPALQQSYRLRDLVELLGESDEPSATQLLIELLRSDAIAAERHSEVVHALSGHADDATAGAFEEQLDAVYTRMDHGEPVGGGLYDLHRAIANLARTNSRLRGAVLGRATTAASARVRSALTDLLGLLEGEDAALAMCQLLTDPPPEELPYGVTRVLEAATTRKEPAGSSGAYWLLPKASNALRRRLFEAMMADPDRQHYARRALLLIENRRARVGRPPDEPRHPAGWQPATWREEYPALVRRPWAVVTLRASDS